jgi:hypothetical protein
MFDLSAASGRRDRRLQEERFRAQHHANVDAWEAWRQWGAQIAPERAFWGSIEDLAQRSGKHGEATCRGAGIHFEACWPIRRSCPGVRECADMRKRASANARA